MQSNAETTGIEAISKAEMSILSAFHGTMIYKYLKSIILQSKVEARYLGNFRCYFPQLIDYKHSAGHLNGYFSLRNISATLGG